MDAHAHNMHACMHASGRASLISSELARPHICGQMSMHMSIHMSIRMSMHMSIRMSMHMSIRMSIHMSIRMSMHMLLRMSIRMSVHMSIHISFHMSVHMFVHMSMHTIVHVSMHISVHASVQMPLHMCVHMSTRQTMRTEFFELAGRCKSVVACRFKPDQKAKMVTEIKTRNNAVTLAIGDGNNDEQAWNHCHSYFSPKCLHRCLHR